MCRDGYPTGTEFGGPTRGLCAEGSSYPLAGWSSCRGPGSPSREFGKGDEAFHEVGHFDRRLACFIAFINSSDSRSRIRLFFGVGGQHTEDDRHPVVIRHPRDPAADLGTDVLKVGRLPADHSAETDDGVIAAGTRQSGRDQGGLECPGDEHHVDWLFPGPPLAPSV